METIVKIIIIAVLLVMAMGLVLALCGELGKNAEIIGSIIALAAMIWMSTLKKTSKK